MDFVSPETGWVIGTNGTVRHTIDGGANWSLQTSGTSSDIHAVDFVDEEHGWYVSPNRVGETVNGGATWYNTGPTFSGSSARILHDVEFVDTQYGLIVGALGTVQITENGGTDWDDLPLGSVGTSAELFGIFMLDHSTGWIVGLFGTLSKSIDGGRTWVGQASGTSATLRGVVAFEVPAVGDYNSDGTVDTLDYDKWRSLFGSNADGLADGNGNGIVDAADYVVWRASVARGGASTTQEVKVPEPSTLLLAVFATLGLVNRMFYREG